MKTIATIFTAALLLTMSIYAQTGKKIPNPKTGKVYPVQKSEAEWKKILSPLAFEVMVNRGTEQAFRNAYHNNHEKGIYVSAATGEPLFRSEDKFDSGTGWPSFSRPINARVVAIITDKSHGMVRDEVIEAKTGLHLGHVFNDGPRDKGGKRYCMNSAALKFIRKVIRKNSALKASRAGYPI
ncbi:MAG: peptide-methionine (R)-S-oxide reductase MsrB [Daejeonella sp.]